MINLIKTSTKDEEFVKPKRSFCPKVVNCDPYEGCEHACVYCVAIDHESDLLVAKENYPLVLEQFLDSSKNTHPVYVGSWTDVYQPAEEEAGLTREIVRLLQHRNHPFFIITKAGDLVARDVDLFQRNPGNINLCFSISTCDESIQKQIEPGAASPRERLSAIKTIPNDVRKVLRVDPLIPGLTTDKDNIEEVIRRAKEMGVQHVTGEILRLTPAVIFNMRKKLGDGFVNSLLHYYDMPDESQPDSAEEVIRTEQERIIKRLYTLTKEAGLTFSTCHKNKTIAPSHGACIGVNFNKRS